MMSDIPISAAWVFLLGGILGVISVLLAKNFSWSNSEFLANEEDRKQEVPMTPLRRWILVGICISVSAYGAVQLQRDHAWNPFPSGGGARPTLTR
jgi:hypothetical protein